MSEIEQWKAKCKTEREEIEEILKKLWELKKKRSRRSLKLKERIEKAMLSEREEGKMRIEN